MQRRELLTYSFARQKRYTRICLILWCILLVAWLRAGASAQVVSQGEPWTAALAGHTVDPLKQQEEQQRLMLERFQEEV